MPSSVSKDIDKYLNIEHPLSKGKASTESSTGRDDHFDFDLFVNSWGTFEFEQWILTNQSRSWDSKLCLTDYLINEAVDQQFNSKLDRLNQLKAQTDKLDQEMKKERLRKLSEINKKMRNWLQEEEPFVAYENMDNSILRRRSRGLTFEENTELMKYQKRSGIHIKSTQAVSYPSIPTGSNTSSAPSGGSASSKTGSFRSTTGNSSQTYPNYPQANQPTSSFNGAAGGYPTGYPSSNPPAGYPQPVPPRAEESSGIMRWFGFGKK